MGDWNFVEDKVDRSPQHNDDLRVTNEMNKLKTSLDLLDGWRSSNPGSRSFTWEGTFGSKKKENIFEDQPHLHYKRYMGDYK